MRQKSTPPKPAEETSVPAEGMPANGRRKWYIVLLIVGLVVLAVATVLAATGVVGGLEQRLFALVNHAQLPGWLTEQLAKPVSNAVWGMVFLVTALLLVPKYRLIAWQYAVAAGSAYVTVYILEHVVDRARPVALEGYNAVLRASQDGPGYPSGHVAVLLALGLTAWPFISWPWRVFILVLVATEAWSRIFLGVHAPLDVVGAAGAAAAVVAVIHLLPEKIRKIFKIAA